MLVGCLIIVDPVFESLITCRHTGAAARLDNRLNVRTMVAIVAPRDLRTS